MILVPQIFNDAEGREKKYVVPWMTDDVKLILGVK